MRDDSRLVLEAMADRLLEISRTLNSIEQTLRPKGKAVAIEIYFDTLTGPVKARDMGKKVLVPGEKATGKISITDAQGNPAKVDGIPAYSLTDDSMGVVEAAADGLTFSFTSSGKVGSCLLQVRADADLSGAVEELLGEGEIEVVSGKAVKVELAFD